MKALPYAVGAIAWTLGFASSATLAACGCGDTTDAGCGQKVCIFTPEEATEEKHCWCVDCKEICIPKVRCPWEKGGSKLTCFSWLKRCGKGKSACGCGDVACSSCCDDGCCESGCCGAKPRCGKVKCVRDLRKEKYEVDVCKWKGEVRRLPPCCCEYCGGDGGCCDCVPCGS